MENIFVSINPELQGGPKVSQTFQNAINVFIFIFLFGKRVSVNNNIDFCLVLLRKIVTIN